MKKLLLNKTAYLLLILIILLSGTLLAQVYPDPITTNPDNPIYVGPVGAVTPGIIDPTNPNPPTTPINPPILENYTDGNPDGVEICGTDLVNQGSTWGDRQAQMMEEWQNNTGELNRANIITIPVVFHIIHNGEPIGTGRNLSVAQIQSQLDVLNQDFRKANVDANQIMILFAGLAADVEVQFCLAIQDPNGNATTGINRIYSPIASFSVNAMETTIKPIQTWNRNSYLNFYVSDIAISGTLGWARFPGGAAALDGIVCDYRTIGRPPFNNFVNFWGGRYGYGRVATHEIGHWLGLQHTFANGCGNQNQCATTGDNICDTPPKNTPTWGCPVTYLPPQGIPIGVYQCGFLSNTQNYMDYVDSRCMHMFTIGQKNAMRGVLNTIRFPLQNSQGCQPPCAPPVIALNNIATTNNTATINWVAVPGALSYIVMYRNFAGGPFPWINIPVPGNGAVLNNLAPFTPYEISVISVCAGGNSAASPPFVFWTKSNQFYCGYDMYENMIFYPPMQNNLPIFGMICPQGDVDFQVIQNNIPNATIIVTLDQLPADYNLELRGYNGNIFAGSYNLGLQQEVITYNNAMPGIYYPTVFSNIGQWNNLNYFRMRSVIMPPPPGGRESNEEKAKKWLEGLSVYPNPAHEEAILIFSNVNNETSVNINLIDLKGSLVRNYVLEIQDGSNELSLDVKGLESGSYYIRINTPTIQSSIPLIIQQ